MTVPAGSLPESKSEGREDGAEGLWPVTDRLRELTESGEAQRDSDDSRPEVFDGREGPWVGTPDLETLGRRGPIHEAAIRLLNFSVAALSLIVAAPLFLVVAVAIKLDSEGPVFYRQLRVGVDRRGGHADQSSSEASRRTGDLGGRPFVLYKFRTMEVNAEDDTGPSWAGRDDDRITRVGRFLRKHRLDELPQLWNVVKGDMAVVGPRPERPLFFQKLRQVFDVYPKRQTVPPGITGWAQINHDSDRSLDDVEHKLRYDLQYLRRRSLWFDLLIMLKTPVVMVKREILNAAAMSDDDGHHTSPKEKM